MNEDLVQFYEALKADHPDYVEGVSAQDFISTYGNRADFMSFLGDLKSDIPDYFTGVSDQDVLDAYYPLTPSKGTKVPESPDYVNLIPAYEEGTDLISQLDEQKSKLVSQYEAQELAAKKAKKVAVDGIPYQDRRFDPNFQEPALTNKEKLAIDTKARYDAFGILDLDPNQVTSEEIQRYVTPGKAEEAKKKAAIVDKQFDLQTDGGDRIIVGGTPNERADLMEKLTGTRPYGDTGFGPNSLTAPVVMTADEILAADSIEGITPERLLKLKTSVGAKAKLLAENELSANNLKAQYLQDQFEKTDPKIWEAQDILNRAQAAQQQGTLDEGLQSEALAAQEYLQSIPPLQLQKAESISQAAIQVQRRDQEIKRTYPELGIIQTLNTNLQLQRDAKQDNMTWMGKALLGVGQTFGEALPRLGEGMSSTYDALAAGLGDEEAQARQTVRSLQEVPVGQFRDATVQKRPMSERLVLDFKHGDQVYELAFDEDGNPTNIYSKTGNLVVLDEATRQDIFKQARDQDAFRDAKIKYNGSAIWNQATDATSDLLGTIALASATGGTLGLGARMREFSSVMLQYTGRTAEEGLRAGLNYEQAAGYGLSGAGMEAAIEIANPMIGNLTSKASTVGVRQAIQRLILNGDTKALAKMGTREFLREVGESVYKEGGEEIFPTILQPIIDQAYNNYNNEELFQVQEFTVRGALEAFGLGAAISVIPGIVGGIRSKNRVHTDEYLSQSVFSVVKDWDKAQPLFREFNLDSNIERAFEATRRRVQVDMEDKTLSEDEKVKRVAAVFDAEKKRLDAQMASSTIHAEEVQADFEDMNALADSILRGAIPPKYTQDVDIPEEVQISRAGINEAETTEVGENVPERGITTRTISALSEVRDVPVEDDLKSAIVENGVTPILVQKGTNQILDGEHRVAILKDLGITNVPILEVNQEDYSEDEWVAFMDKHNLDDSLAVPLSELTTTGVGENIQTAQTPITPEVPDAEIRQPDALKDVEYELRRPESNELVFVDVDKILERHSKDDPNFDVTNQKNQIGNRVQKAKDFLLAYLGDRRFVNPRTGERTNTKVKFEPSVASVNDGKLGFEDGRHRILAAKELGLRTVGIEVPKNQAQYFKDTFGQNIPDEGTISTPTTVEVNQNEGVDEGVKLSKVVKVKSSKDIAAGDTVRYESRDWKVKVRYNDGTFKLQAADNFREFADTVPFKDIEGKVEKIDTSVADPIFNGLQVTTESLQSISKRVLDVLVRRLQKALNVKVNLFTDSDPLPDNSRRQEVIDNSNALFYTRDGVPIGYNYDTDQVARERFDIPNLTKIGEGSDRVVFDLGDGKVLKVAKTPRGLEQNIHEGDGFLDFIPDVYEKGLNYVVAQKTPRAKNSDVVPIYDPETQTEIGTSTIGQMIKELGQFSQQEFDRHDSKVQDVLYKYGFADALSYNLLWLDFAALRNWGYLNGNPVHLDGGTLGGVQMLSTYRGKKPLSDPEFRDIYNKSRQAKREYGDKDKYTKFHATINGQDVPLARLPEDLGIVDGFYSPIEKILLESKQESRRAKQWLEQFGKGDEVTFTGLRKFLEDKKPSEQVKKDTIIDYIRNNRIQLVEVVKGTGTEDKSVRERMEDIRTSARKEGYIFSIDYENDPMLIRADAVNQDYEEEFEAAPSHVRGMFNEYTSLQRQLEGEDTTQYGGYTLAGEKSNYREVLVTLPERREPVSYNIRTRDNGRFEVFNETTGDQILPSFETREQAEDLLAKYTEGPQRFLTRGNFQSQHWNEPNILVHLRMDTRIDSEGNRVLFIEELQSDWAQQGRKQGFKTTLADVAHILDPIEKELNDYGIRVVKGGANFFRFDLRPTFDRDGNVSTTWMTVDDAAYVDVPEERPRELMRQYKDTMRQVDNYSAKPRAPFVTDTNAWVKLGLKVAMRHAVKEGASKVVWTTGDQQNERYGLASVVDSINYKQDGTSASDGSPSYRLEITYKGGQQTTKSVPNTELDDYVGKEIADKIRKGEGQKRYGGVDNKVLSTDLSGLDLEVGGEGMRGFYGHPEKGKLGILGNVAKSLFGDVRRVDINMGDGNKPWYAIYNKVSGNSLGGGYTLQEAKDYVAGKEDLYEYKKVKGKGIDEVVQHSVDITPKIKAEVLRGLPQFLKTPQGVVYGYVLNGQVYLNSDRLNPNTPIHEFGHVWINVMKEVSPRMIQTGLRLVDNSIYLERVNANPAYDTLTKDEKLEEALAQAIGDKGESILRAASKVKFMSWYRKFWIMLKAALGRFAGRRLDTIKPELFDDMTLDEFTALVSQELLGGKDLGSNLLRKVPKDGILRKHSIPPITVYHGTTNDALEEGRDDIIWFTTDPKIADQYRRRAIVSNEADFDGYDDVDEITESESGISVVAEEQGIDLTKGAVISGQLTLNKPLDFRGFDANIEDLPELWGELNKMGLVAESWEDIDEEFQEEMIDNYQGKAVWKLLEGEGIYDSARKQGYDGIIINDVGVNGRPHISYGTFGRAPFTESPKILDILINRGVIQKKCK